ncbi:hypothetical protein DL766_006282 [Monosporascus sp. MC13-8B]|uniref:MARVEL domain-containing protein n=1 Tax=Monosporascus cannonballus TaxID=155416 RepID=A0ABY0HDY5_9PEZI|nr:hypothetical protein DL762_003843 [Monosporascus cannonballus]RYO92836.1 hypothetical protein DL763_004561 [Monosporascus cannonballus]RYP27687.1 hypothetical protein DL766_006282 [Monosporascus sp. MC13-8B]
MAAHVFSWRGPASNSKSDRGDSNRVLHKKGKGSSSTKKSQIGLQGLPELGQPMNLDYTIDQRPQEGEKNPPGYHSNSLITIVRGFQAIAGLIIIGIYLPPAASVPAGTREFPLAIAAFASVTILMAGVLLFYRHMWNTYVVVSELVALAGWITVVTMSPRFPLKEYQGTASYAMDAAILLWLETLFLVTVFPLLCFVYCKYLKRDNATHEQRSGGYDSERGTGRPPGDGHPNRSRFSEL